MLKAFSALLLVIALSNFSASAFECTQFEAEIIAKVAKTEDTKMGCRVTADSFRHYNMHALCPLLIEDVFQKGIIIKDTSCSDVNLGDDAKNPEISGYAFQAVDSDFIFIDL